MFCAIGRSDRGQSSFSTHSTPQHTIMASTLQTRKGSAMKAISLCTVFFLVVPVCASWLQAADSTIKTFTYKKTKQADLELVVHYPPGWKDTDKRPGIVFFFGGGWTGGKIEQFEPQASHLANRGMVAARA